MTITETLHRKLIRYTYNGTNFSNLLTALEFWNVGHRLISGVFNQLRSNF